ncbi:hypothetical protein [Lacticaseibacillus paracasei]|uniref:hypothetical protein n=1 Tax=Lacticaseibacillus paracasei TaxID=1597 RepID=UPI0021C2ECD5|nr:hypothetical protein [Lacticaseibacillus paracasei]MCP9305697.1 hypothetical protein [Lacticaseibacillus paracasei]
MAIHKVYHGTPYDSGKAMIEGGKSAVRIRAITKKKLFDGVTFDKGRRQFGNPGSLGFGFYTFLEDPNAARRFAEKFSKETIVFEIDANFNEDTTLRLDCDPEDISRFTKFLNDQSFAKDIKYLEKKYKNGPFQKSLDGALVELYCILSKEGRIANFQVVCSSTTSNIGLSVLNSSIPNGIEACIKDKAVIISDEFRIVHEDEESSE